jgi:zinc D-Ala-D-Ala carboxypeptidase
MNLTTHFTLAEVTATETKTLQAANLKAFTVEHAVNAARLAYTVLEPLRNTLGVPIKINSWFRCPELNTAVGGAATSEHLTGAAADIRPACDMWTAYEWLESAPIGQRIMYLSAAKTPLWIHVSAIPRASKAERSLVCLVGGPKKKYIAFAGKEKTYA